MPAASNRSGVASCEPTPRPKRSGGSPCRTTEDSEAVESPAAALPGSKPPEKVDDSSKPEKLDDSANGVTDIPSLAAELGAVHSAASMEPTETGKLPPADLDQEANGPAVHMWENQHQDQNQHKAQERLNSILAELGSLRDEISECRTEYGLAKDRAKGLEAENGSLRCRLREAEQRAADFQGRMKELEGERESWKQLWEQMQFQLEECRKKYDGIAERWKQAHEQMRAAKKDRDTDRRRLRQAEQLLEELGRPLPPSIAQDALPAGAASPPPPCTGGTGAGATSSVSSSNAYAGCSSPRMGSLPSNSLITRSPVCELFGDPASGIAGAPAAGWKEVDHGTRQRTSLLAAPTVLPRGQSLEQQPAHAVLQAPAAWSPPVVPSLGCLALPAASSTQLAGVKQQAFDPGRGSLPSNSCMARCSVPTSTLVAQDAVDTVFTL